MTCTMAYGMEDGEMHMYVLGGNKKVMDEIMDDLTFEDIEMSYEDSSQELLVFEDLTKKAALAKLGTISEKLTPPKSIEDATDDDIIAEFNNEEDESDYFLDDDDDVNY